MFRLFRKKADGLLSRLSDGLKKTRFAFTNTIASLFLGKKTIDAELLASLKKNLLEADLGPEATHTIIQTLETQLNRNELKDGAAVFAALKIILKEWLLPFESRWELPEKRPYVILMVGANGNGKTTTIGKLAHQLKQEGLSVLLAAGDTFRAAAVEQLKVWGERAGVPVIAQSTGSDSASVIFDAMQAATARKADVLIADTAGRLHTKTHLMEELKKIKRVLTKLDPQAPHEVWLVLDATTGQNARMQAKTFQEALGLTGLVLTKLDGTAKGGVIFALCSDTKLPIRLIGVGEQIEDLRPFEAESFVNALLE